MNYNPDSTPLWNAELAEELIGCILLVGITRLDPSGEVGAHEQMFGRVGLTDPKRGVRIDLEGTRQGEAYWLPPDLRSVHRASPGHYRLKSTGEVVVDPDFVCQWTITKRADA